MRIEIKHKPGSPDVSDCLTCGYWTGECLTKGEDCRPGLYELVPVAEVEGMRAENKQFRAAIWSDDSTADERGKETPEDAARFVSDLRAENERLKKDVEYLSARIQLTGGYHANEERDYGASSNSIAAIAYGLDVLAVMPMDISDLAACERMWAKLPEHRRTASATEAIRQARAALEGKA